MRLAAGFRPDQLGSLQRFSRPPSWILGVGIGKEGKGREERKGRRGKRGEERKRGEKGKEGGTGPPPIKKLVTGLAIHIDDTVVTSEALAAGRISVQRKPE